MKKKLFSLLTAGIMLSALQPAAVSGENSTQPILMSGQMRITLVDYDTGEPIALNEESFPYVSTNVSYNTPDGPIYTGPILALDTNPSVHENIAGFFSADSFSFSLDEYNLPECYSFPDNADRISYYNGTILPEDALTVTRYDNDSADVVFRLKYSPSGDVNDDGRFTVADVVLLEKWLNASPDAELINWKAADFCNDDKLNVFDILMMKHRLFSKTAETYVQPDIMTEYDITFSVLTDGLELYLGPDTSYPAAAKIPQYTGLRELGYNENNNYWLFTEYEGQQGWVRIYTDDDVTPAIQFEMAAKKPVIYLYPEEETDVHVELELTEAELSTTYPKYNNGWDVTAYPDGSLLNKADGSHHRYLFWDAVNCRTRFDLSKGFCVAGCDTEEFLKEKLTYMGLTEDEMNEFIVYWLPLMEHNAYNLISFQGDAYTNSAKLTITPTPDSECRIFMAYVPLENAVDIEPQELPEFERKGFSVVEWGGSEIR